MYNKKALRTIVKNLDKAKAPAKPKDIIVDPMGQWKYPGQKTRIPGGDITMQGVSYPVWAQPNVGTGQLMQPGQDYKFPGADYVDETPIAKKGGSLKKYSRSLEAKNKIFADNPLTKKPKSKKIFDPTSKNYKNGGVNQTPSLPLKAGREVYETFAYGMYDRPGWQKQDGGEAWDAELTDEEIQAYRDAGYEVEDLEDNTFQQGGYFSYGDKKYMKKDGKWLVESNGKYIPLSKNVAERSAVLNKQAKYVKPSASAKSQYELDQEARKANYFNPDYSVLPNIKQQVAESTVPAISYDKQLQANRTGSDARKSKEAANLREETIQAVKYNSGLPQDQIDDILMDPRKLAKYKYLGEQRMYGNPQETEINNRSKTAPQGLFSKGLDVLSNPFTAITTMGSGEGLPDYMQKNLDRGTFAYTKNAAVHTERNPLDYVVDFTPLGLINDARNVVNGIAEGDWGKIGWGLAGAVPGVSELRSAGKAANLGSKASKVVKPVSKNVKRAVDIGYSGLGKGIMNKYNPLNLVPNYGKAVNNPRIELGNVLEDVVRSGNATVSQGPLQKMTNTIRRTPTPVMKAGKNTSRNNAKSIFQLEVNPNTVGSNVKYANDPIKRTGQTYRNVRKAINPKYDVNNKAAYELKYGRNPATQIPLSDPGVALQRRLPFSNRYVKVDPAKLANNQVQWATRGTGLQNLAEKYGSTALTLPAIAALLSGHEKGYGNVFSNTISKIDPYSFVKDYNPYYVKDIYKGLIEKDGGEIEMDADEDMINYLRSQGYTVEDID